MNPLDELHRGRLRKALEVSYRELLPFRELTRGLVEEYAGSGYGRPNRPRHEIYVNLMNQTVDAYTMALVANRPRVLVSTQFPDRVYFARQYQEALNNLIQEIGLEFTLRNWVLDAFFSVGIVKVHMADAGLVQLENDIWMDPGKPFASNVSLDNWVHDMSATRWGQIKYAADCYRIPFDDLQHPMYDPAVVRDLQPSVNGSTEEIRLERLSRSESIDADELDPMIDLADVWIPRDRKIYTFPLDRKGLFRLMGPPVAVMDWDGSEHGPYHLLGLNDVPENIMPTSPASHLSTLSRLANNLIRKQARQAVRQKDIHTYTPAGAKDAQRIQQANDGAFIQVQDGTQIGEVRMGGVDPSNQAFLLGVMEMYDRFAGNLTAMLGLGAQAPTASQEQIIQGKVSNKEAQMQYRVLDAASRLIRDLGGMLWNDQVKVIPGQIPIDGAEGYFVDATWRPDDREGTFYDYQIDIDVFSMGYTSPAARANTLNQLITQVYAPLGGLLSQQGGQLNLQKLVELHAELLNIPQLRECIQFQTILPGEGAETTESPALPSSTTRTYQRQNIPTGGTQQSRNHIQQQAWLNGSVSPQQSGAMARQAA